MGDGESSADNSPSVFLLTCRSLPSVPTSVEGDERPANRVVHVFSCPFFGAGKDGRRPSCRIVASPR